MATLPYDQPGVSVRKCATLFFSGSDCPSLEVIASVAAWVAETGERWRFRFARSAAELRWNEFDDLSIARITERLSRQWMFELCSEPDGTGCKLGVSRACNWRGSPMASHMSIEFVEDASAATLAAFATWAIDRIPFMWGSVGFVFARPFNWGFYLDDKATRAAAKRYWAIQILDPVLLQRDALRGMPGVNWLTLVGSDFAGAVSLSIDALAAQASDLVGEGIFHRRGRHGLALAAGRRPLLGDVNLGDDLTAYARVAGLLHPLMLREHTLLAGPLERPEVASAWLGRFENPKDWLNCEIAAD